MTLPKKIDVEQLRRPTLKVDRLGRRWVGLPVEQRLLARVNRGDPSDCWPWSGYTNRHGYGVIGLHDRRTALTHRVAYILHHGVDPAPLVICHTCDNPPCCNPAHLFAGTQLDNVADRDTKGRVGKRLSDEQVCQIRELRAAGATYAQLAESFAISEKYVGRIVSNRARAANFGGVTPCAEPRSA